MKPFDIHTRIESNTDYVFAGDRLCVELADTVHLEESIYRSIYPSEKRYLDTAFYLKGVSNVTLDFGGATLYLRDDTIQPFVLDGCEGITVKNLTLEYERSLMDEMDLVEIRDGELWFRQTEKQKKHFPMRVGNGRLIPICGEKEYPFAFEKPHFFNLYDKETHLCRVMCLVRIGIDLPPLPKKQYPFPYYNLVAEERGEYIVMRGELPPGLMSGVTCAQCHASRDLSSFFIIRSGNTRLENVRVLNGGGMGILGMYAENLTLDGLKLYYDERSHGIATNAADAVHLIACRGKVEIANSVFESMKDDALNVHGNYYTVQAVEEGVIHARLHTDVQLHPGVSAHYQVFGRGDTVAVYHGGTMRQKKMLTIERVEVTGDFSADLYVRGDLSGLLEGDTVENLDAQAELYVHHCRFGKSRTHLRLQTRGKILIEDCECALKILLSGDKNYWYEGSPVRDLTIRNCCFSGERAFISAVPEFDVCPEAPYYHSGIRILGNRFDILTPIRLSYCKDVLVADNVHEQGLSFENEFLHCDNVTDESCRKA